MYFLFAQITRDVYDEKDWDSTRSLKVEWNCQKITVHEEKPWRTSEAQRRDKIIDSIDNNHDQFYVFDACFVPTYSEFWWWIMQFKLKESQH